MAPFMGFCCVQGLSMRRWQKRRKGISGVAWEPLLAHSYTQKDIKKIYRNLLKLCNAPYWWRNFPVSELCLVSGVIIWARFNPGFIATSQELSDETGYRSQKKKYTEDLFALGFKMRLGRKRSRELQRHVAVYVCVYHASPRCPADRLCSDFLSRPCGSTDCVSVVV